MDTVDGQSFMVDVRMRGVFHHFGAYDVLVLRLSQEA